MRRARPVMKALLAVVLAAACVGCTADRAPDPFGSIRLVTGPESDLIVAAGQYHLRNDFDLVPFAYGPSSYITMDSAQSRPVLRFADFEGVVTSLDSLEPGMYNVLVYVSRLSVNQVKVNTSVVEGDTVITDPTATMGPYEYYFRPIFVDDIRVAADSVTLVDLSAHLESWQAPKQLADGGWQVERVRYLPWAGVMAAE